MACSKEFQLEVEASSQATLVMQLSAGVGITHSSYGGFERIDSWADQSGHGNNATQGSGDQFMHPGYGNGLDPGATGLNAYGYIIGNNAGTDQCGLEHNLSLAAPCAIIAVAYAAAGSSALDASRCLASFGYSNLYHAFSAVSSFGGNFGVDAGGDHVPGPAQIINNGSVYGAERVTFGAVIRAYNDITTFCQDTPGLNALLTSTPPFGFPFVSAVKRIGNLGAVDGCRNSQLYELRAYSGLMDDTQRDAIILDLRGTYG